MSTELTMLVATTVLCMLLPGVYGYGRANTPGGLEWGLGNRDAAIEFPAWVGRAERAHRNLLENLPPFAVLILVAVIARETNWLTAMAAVVFFFARVAHAVIYVAGTTSGARTVAYGVGMFAELLILLKLVF